MSVPRRVVVTGLGVISPNGYGFAEFNQSLKLGKSGIRYNKEMADNNLLCQVAGIPENLRELISSHFNTDFIYSIKSNMVAMGCIAGLDCWRDAGLPESEYQSNHVIEDTGVIVGTCVGSLDMLINQIIPLFNNKNLRRAGSGIVEVMSSAVPANLSGLLGLGGISTTTSCACSSGSDAILQGYNIIREGMANRMLVGGAEGGSIFFGNAFNHMHVLSRNYNDQPERSSRPMSASSTGFVPAEGAGMLVLEDLETAVNRNARIYAEVVGGCRSCGGHRNGGGMTTANPDGIKKCIKGALASAGIKGSEVDVINGHLTGTLNDVNEILCWKEALDVSFDKFPLINSTKSMIGHTIGAAGGIESIASILQIYNRFVHPSINCEDLHPSLEMIRRAVPQKTIEKNINIIAKANFGFGDVNVCLIFKKFIN